VSEQEQPKRSSILEELLSRAGLTSELLQKVRFGGPVGKLALLGIACVVGLCVIAFRTGNGTAGLCAVLATIVALAVAAGILWYSDKHPDQATLEGMELVVMQQQKFWAEAVAKGGTPLPPGLQFTIPEPKNTIREIE
jgi:hypothetical protein